MTEIRNYDQRYEAELIDLWNRCCTFDPVEVHKFRRQVLFDENFNPAMAWTAIDQERLVGFGFATKRKYPYLERGLEPERGWINVFFVDPDYRRQGIGQQMYDRMELQLKERGTHEITLGAYSPGYFFWGLDPDHYPESVSFFRKNGYIQGSQHYSMGMSLHGYQIPEQTHEKMKLAEGKGYRFLEFDYRYCLELLDFLRRELGAGWERNALISMRENTAEDLQLIVLNPQGKICGWCMRAIDGNPMRFGPIGISASERNAGLGSILLAMQCYEMEKKGIYQMFFVTTDDAGRRYYERNGLSVIRRFVDYRKRLI